MGRNMFIALMVIFLIAGAGSATPAQANLITNGSFEEGEYTAGDSGDFMTLYAGNMNLTGWQITGSVDWINSYWRAYDGSKGIDLNGDYPGGLTTSQTFNTNPGQVYLVSFALSGNFEAGRDLKELQVSIIQKGEIVNKTFEFAKPDGWSHENMGWVVKSFTFMATDSSATLAFASLETKQGIASGPVIDAVSVSPVPLPGSVLLLGTGILGLVLLGMRRREV